MQRRSPCPNSVQVKWPTDKRAKIPVNPRVDFLNCVATLEVSVVRNARIKTCF